MTQSHATNQSRNYALKLYNNQQLVYQYYHSSFEWLKTKLDSLMQHTTDGNYGIVTTTASEQPIIERWPQHNRLIGLKW